MVNESHVIDSLFIDPIEVEIKNVVVIHCIDICSLVNLALQKPKISSEYVHFKIFNFFHIESVFRVFYKRKYSIVLGMFICPPAHLSKTAPGRDDIQLFCKCYSIANFA